MLPVMHLNCINRSCTQSRDQLPYSFFFKETGGTQGVPTGNLLNVTKKVTENNRVYKKNSRKTGVQETKEN